MKEKKKQEAQNNILKRLIKTCHVYTHSLTGSLLDTFLPGFAEHKTDMNIAT